MTTTHFAIARDSQKLIEEAKGYGIKICTLDAANEPGSADLVRIVYPDGINPVDLANIDGFGKDNIIVSFKKGGDVRERLVEFRYALTIGRNTLKTAA